MPHLAYLVVNYISCDVYITVECGQWLHPVDIMIL